MSRTVTWTNGLARIRELADIEGTTGVAYMSDAKLLAYANASRGVWHGMVAQANPERYSTSEDITATGAASYNLPADYYASLYVEEVDGDNRRELQRLMPNERNRFGNGTGDACGYWIIGGTLRLVPKPTSGTYRHWYVQHAEEFATGSDTVDGVNGWEEWIWLDVAIKVLLKQRSDISQLAGIRDGIAREILAAAADRSKGDPARVTDGQSNPLTAGPYNWNGDPDFWSNR
jgi:hypothetical protein